MAKKFTDPADRMSKVKEDQAIDDDMKTFDISNLSMQDFKQLEHNTARESGPFEGYPIKESMKIDDIDISSTYIVGLNPSVYVPQDPSGKRVTIVVDKRDGSPPKDKIVTLKTYHSRVIKDYDNGQVMTDVVFDRVLNLKDGKVMVALVKSHSVRAQLLFQLTRAGVKVDTRYVLLDSDQKGRLRKYFGIINNPHLKVERLSNAISGESDDSLDDL